MALTIAGSQEAGWTAVAQNTATDVTNIDLSASYASHLTIDLGFTQGGVAHTGTRVIVEVSSHASSAEFWSPLLDFIALVGTANEEAITNNPLTVGSTNITVADTTGFAPTLADGGSQLIFLKDASLANSELCRCVAVTANTNITVSDLTTREHAATTSKLYSIADSFVVDIPFGILRAKVHIDNTYDINGATIAYRVRKTITTALT